MDPGGGSPPDRLRRSLPEALLRELGGIDGEALEEIHLTAGRSMWIRLDGNLRQMQYVVSQNEPEQILMAACGGSRYAVEETLKEGFFCMEGGVRVGVCGRVTVRGGVITALPKVESLCIRLPGKGRGDAHLVRPLLDSFSFCRGILVYAPPGGGKTTFLRQAAMTLSCGRAPKRVVVVDPREEFAYALKAPGLCVDVLSGYPMAQGIELALRTLGAEVVICDEISPRDVGSLLALHSGGVPLLASVHGAILSDVLNMSGVARLHRAHIFGAYLRPERDASPKVTLWEDV